MIAEQNLSNCKAHLKDMGVADDAVEALTNPSAGDSLILSGNEDNYLTALVVKVRRAPRAARYVLRVACIVYPISCFTPQ